MDPVTIAAGFAIAKKSIELCKSALDTADDVNIFGPVARDELFVGEK